MMKLFISIKDMRNSIGATTASSSAGINRKWIVLIYHGWSTSNFKICQMAKYYVKL